LISLIFVAASNLASLMVKISFSGAASSTSAAAAGAGPPPPPPPPAGIIMAPLMPSFSLSASVSSDASSSVSPEIWSTRAWIFGDASGAAHKPRLEPATPQPGRWLVLEDVSSATG